MLAAGLGSLLSLPGFGPGSTRRVRGGGVVPSQTGGVGGAEGSVHLEERQSFKGQILRLTVQVCEASFLFHTRPGSHAGAKALDSTRGRGSGFHQRTIGRDARPSPTPQTSCRSRARTLAYLGVVLQHKRRDVDLLRPDAGEELVQAVQVVDLLLHPRHAEGGEEPR